MYFSTCLFFWKDLLWWKLKSWAAFMAAQFESHVIVFCVFSITGVSCRSRNPNSRRSGSPKRSLRRRKNKDKDEPPVFFRVDELPDIPEEVSSERNETDDFPAPANLEELFFATREVNSDCNITVFSSAEATSEASESISFAVSEAFAEIEGCENAEASAKVSHLLVGSVINCMATLLHFYCWLRLRDSICVKSCRTSWRFLSLGVLYFWSCTPRDAWEHMHVEFFAAHLRPIMKYRSFRCRLYALIQTVASVVKELHRELCALV